VDTTSVFEIYFVYWCQSWFIIYLFTMLNLILNFRALASEAFDSQSWFIRVCCEIISIIRPLIYKCTQRNIVLELLGWVFPTGWKRCRLFIVVYFSSSSALPGSHNSKSTLMVSTCANSIYSPTDFRSYTRGGEKRKQMFLCGGVRTGGHLVGHCFPKVDAAAQAYLKWLPGGQDSMNRAYSEISRKKHL